MKYSQLISEFVADHEEQHGIKPSAEVLRVAEHIGKMADRLVELGQKDRNTGKPAYSTDFFRELVKYHFTIADSDGEEELVSAIAALWQTDYMAGYNEVPTA